MSTSSDTALVDHMLKSLLASHYCAGEALGTKVLFCDPQSLLAFYDTLSQAPARVIYCLTQTNFEVVAPCSVTSIASLQGLPEHFFHQIIDLQCITDKCVSQRIDDLRPYLTDDGTIVLSSPTLLLGEQHPMLYRQIPYQFFHTQNAWLIDMIGNPAFWEKTLSWATSEPIFFAFINFLETTLIQKLPPALCQHHLLFLANTPHPKTTLAPVIQRIEDISEATLAKTVTLPLAEWCKQLCQHLSHQRNFILFYKLVNKLSEHVDLDITPYLTPTLRNDIQRMMLKSQINTTTQVLCDSWHQQAGIEPILTHEQISLSSAFSYHLTGALLDQLGAYDETES